MSEVFNHLVADARDGTVHRHRRELVERVLPPRGRGAVGDWIGPQGNSRRKVRHVVRMRMERAKELLRKCCNPHLTSVDCIRSLPSPPFHVRRYRPLNPRKATLPPSAFTVRRVFHSRFRRSSIMCHIGFFFMSFV